MTGLLIQFSPDSHRGVTSSDYNTAGSAGSLSSASWLARVVPKRAFVSCDNLQDTRSYRTRLSTTSGVKLRFAPLPGAERRIAARAMRPKVAWQHPTD